MAETFTSDSRLFALSWPNADPGTGSGPPDFAIEAWWGLETLSGGFELILDVLSPDAHLDLKPLLGQAATLLTATSDGGQTPRTGIVRLAGKSDPDGGFARYRLHLVPWIWLLSQSRHNRVFQERSLMEIIDLVFADHAPYAAWQWSEEVADFLAEQRPRSYCVQYRETDYAFVSRLLAEEGLGWCVEEDDSAPYGHRLRLFADSRRFPEDPQSLHANGGQGIRYHRDGDQEDQDAVNAFMVQRRLTLASLSSQSPDYKHKAAVAASLPTWLPDAGPRATRGDAQDDPGPYAFAHHQEAERALALLMEAREARHVRHLGRSSVRSLRPGSVIDLVGDPYVSTLALAGSTDPRRYQILQVLHGGINNLPAASMDALARRLGDPLAGSDPAMAQALDAFQAFDPLTTSPFFCDPALQSPTDPTDPLPDDTTWDWDPGWREGESGSEEPTGASEAPASFRPTPGLLPMDTDLPGDTDPHHPVRAPDRLPAPLLDLIRRRGYGNQFTALLGDRPWRPVLEDDTGQRLNPRPTVHGPMTATVVGPRGETAPAGPDELWCDALGRVMVRFPWQQGLRPDDTGSCWLRVVQRQAGPGMGWQWLPRIGQEVLVGFNGLDADRPIILGALYNGRGEGGVPATPGGTPGESDTSVFDAATDHRPAGQGNLTGGHSPAWHGGAAASHRHPAALSGFKTKEFGGAGYSHLVFDDSDKQLRVQLKTTLHMSEFNLGHLIHQADNYRGSFRGSGLELRTDAWGALRAGRGLLMTTWPQAASSQPAGDAAGALALLKQAQALAGTLSDAATTHQTVALAAHLGAAEAQRCTLDDANPPLAALVRAASGMVTGAHLDDALADGANKQTEVMEGKVPHLTDPLILQAARGGLGMVAGRNLHQVVGETLTWASGGDTDLAVAGRARLHSGQAIGVLAGAIRPGPENTGMTMIAAQDDVDWQAQSDVMKVQAKEDLTLVSANAQVDFAGAKRIVIAVKGGASITIDGGITVQCPGTITVKASRKSFSGPTSLDREALSFLPPDNHHVQPILYWDGTDDPVISRRFRAILEDGRVVEGSTDAQGHAQFADAAHFQHATIEVLPEEG
ncbi:MAG: type VI secretion system Vgr family protein [Pseudomonadota bacterium]